MPSPVARRCVGGADRGRLRLGRGSATTPAPGSSSTRRRCSGTGTSRSGRGRCSGSRPERARWSWSRRRSPGRLRWTRLLVLAGCGALAWALALALAEGTERDHGSAGGPERLPRVVAADRLAGQRSCRPSPTGSTSYSTHVRSHPPGMALILWALDASRARRLRPGRGPDPRRRRVRGCRGR